MRVCVCARTTLVYQAVAVAVLDAGHGALDGSWPKVLVQAGTTTTADVHFGDTAADGTLDSSEALGSAAHVTVLKRG